MKLKYAIAIEDFKSLQPPFTTRAGNNAGFKGVLAACGLISLLGVFLLINRAGLPDRPRHHRCDVRIFLRAAISQFEREGAQEKT
jgi:hypothetical protein